MATRHEEAVRALVDALEPLGLASRVTAQATDTGTDLVLSDQVGRNVYFQVKRVSTLTPGVVTDSLPERAALADSDTQIVFVADRVTQTAQEMLRKTGGGWLDLRGHLRLSAAGLLIDTDVPAARPRPERVDVFGGSVGLEVACLLLMYSTAPRGVREMARELGRSASTVSEVLKALREQRLVNAGNKPLLPDLFWETVRVWQPRTLALARLPDLERGRSSMSELLELRPDHIESERGWALTDTMAALAYGAPIIVKSGYPPDFYVPSRIVADRAAQLLGSAPSWETRALTIRVAPVPAVCKNRVSLDSEPWPVVNPLFVALDLARDQARGQEVLRDWTLPKPWRRVW